MMFIAYFITFFFFLVNAQMNFQRNIWVYWETDFDKAPLLTRISYQKLQKAAIQAGWKLILVNGTNIKDYINDYERFDSVVKKGWRHTVQQKSDILRISLIQQNGGVWIDFACILFDNLQWLSNEKIFQHMLINRRGTNLDDPDMLMFGQGWHQSPLSFYNAEGALVTDEYFGMAIHFIAAKKKSPIMTDWKQKMYKISSQSYSEMIGYINDKRLYFHNIDRSDVYYSGNIALESVIQQRQFLLDNWLTLSNQRNIAYEDYKIWSIHGQVGPIAMTRKHILSVRDLFMETREEVQNRMGRLWFYLKIAKYLRQNLQDYQKPTEKYFINNKGLTIDDIIKRRPTTQECQLYYIVKGSIMHSFYKDSKYESEIHMPYITLQQRQQLREYCGFVAPQVYYSSYTKKSEGQMTRPEREIYANNSTSLWQKVRLLWITNSLVIHAGLEQWRAVMFVLLAYIILRNTSTKDLYKAFLGRYRNEFNQKIDFYQMMHSRLNTLQLTMQQSLDPVVYTQLKWSRQKSIAALVIFAKSILAAVSLQFYQNIQDMGKFPQYDFALVIFVVIILVDGLLQRLSSKTIYTTDMFASVQLVTKAMRIAIYLPLGFVVFIHLDTIYGLAYYHTMIIVGGGMLLYMCLQQMKSKGISSDIINAIMLVLHITKYLALLMFLVFYITPNSRYIRTNQYCTKEQWSQLAMDGFVVVFILALVVVNFKVITRIIAIRRGGDKDEMVGLKQMLVSGNFIGLVVYRTYIVYSEIVKNPSWYNHIAFFQFYILIFTACGLSVKLYIPSTLQRSRSIAIYASVYILPCIYLIFGLSLIHNIFINWVVNTLIMMAVSIYVAVVGFIVQQLAHSEQSCQTTVQQSQDMEYEVVKSHQEHKY